MVVTIEGCVASRGMESHHGRATTKGTPGRVNASRGNALSEGRGNASRVNALYGGGAIPSSEGVVDVGVRLIVAGGRDFSDYGRLKAAMAEALGDLPLDQLEVVSGAARGADRLGEQWAQENGVVLRQFPADWNRNGRSAGFRRNEEMADYADAVLVMPGGNGTDHMARIAAERGMTVHDYRSRMPGVVVPVVTAPAFEIVSSRGGDGFDVLGMRSGGKTMATVASPGDAGWLGNPYVAVDAGGRLTREEATARFGELVRQKAQDEQWAEAFRGLRGKSVGYYKPEEEHIHLQELQRWLDEDARAPEQPAAVVNTTGQQVADGVQLKLDLEGQQAQEDPKRKAGDLLPWLLAAGGIGLGAYALAEELNRGNPGASAPAQLV